MSVVIPENLRDLFTRPITCALATTMPDGQPQVTPVWCDYDGQHVIVNTARGRQKSRNMKVGSKVTVLIIDPQDDGHWVEVRGEIEIETEEGAREVISKLAAKYTGNPEFRGRKADEIRVTYKIAPTKVNGE